ncbi:hypothetical protein F471_03721 [Pseudomonas sp. URMO17WK12:I1]|uniref:transcriptional regulator n=1 Tax=unclassified Pseudomonas TaxID=196821 RepID=UPI0004861927|nr:MULTISPECIES: YdaS family helix-turn-helix protein [unclassified Pseudomonas]PZW65243.1 hypothetical protein F471_03721 [Pseudomonas sp. URMO17WK12:I1]
MSSDALMKAAFEEAVKAIGGQSAASRSLTEQGHKISQQLLRHHLKVKGRCPAELVLAFEAMSGVSRYRLRPDVFGDQPAVEARAA